jgi:hypothetical protein
MYDIDFRLTIADCRLQILDIPYSQAFAVPLASGVSPLGDQRVAVGETLFII